MPENAKRVFFGAVILFWKGLAMNRRISSGIGWRIALAVGVAIAASPVLASDFGPVKQMKVDAKKAALGKRLFFDPRLSGDAAISCSTCHIPAKGFADGLALSKAYPGSDGFRNTPTLINTAQKAAWFHDGRIGTNLNDVTRESITETYSMNMDMRLMQERVKQDPIYVKMFKEAGYGEPSNGSIRKAIPEYLKTLTSRGAPFDTGNLSDAAKSGFDLFKGKAGCAACHSGPRFSDDKAHNTGVPENPEIWSNPMRHITYVSFSMFMGIENYMNIRRDVGAHVRTHKSDGTDIGKFMTPTLRELTQTAPYMHNGMIKTLEDVVAFYNRGGGSDPNKDPRIKPLNLSREEQANLVVFLKSLSGEPLTGPEHVWKEKINVNYTAIKDWLNKRN
ncbi:cytochrome c551 peroxidase precursor [bacterium BMS3Bbin10]|nr:cytochrome c551 peroxidase precursor [bacterium BMS3Bbin10]